MADAIDQALDEISFGPDGLVPAIAQQHDTGEVLMVAWMNREAVRLTLAEGRACYWSRSRQALWRKGETSGQLQQLREMRLDCDGDALLLLVDQTGVACHTGRRSCFFRAWRAAAWTTIAAPLVAPEQLYPRSESGDSRRSTAAAGRPTSVSTAPRCRGPAAGWRIARYIR